MRCTECSADTRLCQCAEAERDARDLKMTNARWAAMDNTARARHHAAVDAAKALPKFQLIDDAATLQRFWGWVIGDVIEARYALDGSGRAILTDRGSDAFHIVRGNDYVACCPTLAAALATFK